MDVKRQADQFYRAKSDELFHLYRENEIEYEKLDFSFSSGSQNYHQAVNRGVIHITLLDETVSYHYNTACISSNEIDLLQIRIASIAGSLAEHGSEPLFDTDIISEAEKDIILNRFNNTKKEFEFRIVHTLISDVAEKMPDQLAEVCGDRSITYGELEERSNRLARRLREMGCQRNEFIAIALEKGIEYFVAMLAVIKSGSAFMPIQLNMLLCSPRS